VIFAKIRHPMGLCPQDISWFTFRKSDLYSAKETYNFKEPTNRSHPISHDSLSANSPRILGLYCRKRWYNCVFFAKTSLQRYLVGNDPQDFSSLQKTDIIGLYCRKWRNKDQIKNDEIQMRYSWGPKFGTYSDRGF